MASERDILLTQMVEVITSTISFGERLSNLVHLLGRYLKVDLALYFGLDKTKEILTLQISSKGAIPPHLRLEFHRGQGVVGEVAQTRKPKVVYRRQEGVLALNAPLEKIHPAFNTLGAFPVADDNFLYGVLLLVDREERSFSSPERHMVHLACLMLAGTVRQALLQ